MAKSKEFDVVKFVKLVAKQNHLPVQRVSQIFQKYPLNPAGYKKAVADCEALAAQQVRAQMAKINPFV